MLHAKGWLEKGNLPRIKTDADLDAFLGKHTLEKYPDTLKDSRIVLSTDSEFLKYLKQTKKDIMFVIF